MKNKVKKIVIGLGAFVFVSSAFAQGGEHEVGNGGNAVVCYSDSSKKNIKSVELFDYWEGKRFKPIRGPRGEVYSLDLGGSRLSVEKKIDLFISRVKLGDPERARRYDQYAKLILSDLKSFLVSRLPGEPIDDDHPAGLPSSPCYKEQFAVQFKYPTPGKRRFLIDRGLFSKADSDSKAGIILHEVLYRDAIVRDKHQNSDGVRLLNHFYSTPATHQLPSLAYTKEFYDHARIPFRVNHSYESPLVVTILENLGGLKILTNKSARDGYGELFFNGWFTYSDSMKEINVRGSMRLQYDGSRVLDGNRIFLKSIFYYHKSGDQRLYSGKIKLNGTWYAFGTPESVDGASMVAYLREDGSISELLYRVNGTEITQIQPPLHLNKTSCEAGKVYLNQKQYVTGCMIQPNDPMGFRFPNGAQALLSGDVRFFSSGLLQRANIDRAVTLPVLGSSRHYRFVPRGKRKRDHDADIVLDQSGAVVNGMMLSKKVLGDFNVTEIVTVVAHPKQRNVYSFQKDDAFSRRDGMKMVLSHPSSHNRMTYCALFPDQKYSGQFLGSGHQERALGGKLYFDLGSLLPVTVTDDVVTVYDQAWCYRNDATEGYRFP